MLIPMIILLVFMLVTLYMATQTMLSTTARIIKNDVESRIALEMQDQQDPTVETYKNVVASITGYLRTFSMGGEFKKSLIASMMWVFGIGVLLVILQIVLLTIFFSHRVAGPVFRFEKTCHSMLQGCYTNVMHLRKGDELQNLALLLNEVNIVTSERFQSIKDAATKEDVDKIINELQF